MAGELKVVQSGRGALTPLLQSPRLLPERLVGYIRQRALAAPQPQALAQEGDLVPDALL